MFEINMIKNLILPDIIELLEKKDFHSLKIAIEDLEIPDIAELISDLDENKRALFFRILPSSKATEVFEYLGPDEQFEIIKSLSNSEVSSILNEMSVDDRTDFLEDLPNNVKKKLIDLLSKEEKEIALQILNYPEGSVGRLITTDFITINKDMTMAEAFDHIRKYGHDSETIDMVYVVDDKERLIDDLTLRQLIFAEPSKKISDLMDENFISLNVIDDQETAIEVFKKYDRVALPVVDYSGILLGIVTVDDIIDVAEEEMTEDIQKIGGSETLEEPYSTISTRRMIKKRSIWLSLLFVGEMLTASAMASFEEEISKAVVLALFVPLIISSGGNSGSQAATLVIRAMALQEISVKDWFFVLKREIISGLVLGSILALIGFLRVGLWEYSFNTYGEYWYLIGFTVSFALIGVVCWGTLMGGLLPILLKKLKFDPATSSAPFIATLVDVAGVIIYFEIAFLFLRGTLL